jgi:hypothetical protein
MKFKNWIQKENLAGPGGGPNFSPEDLKPFVSGLYAEYRKLAPTGHEYLTYIFENMFNLNRDAADILLNTAVEKYNAQILHHFTGTGTGTGREFLLREYFDKVYRFNTDVWGTMSVFYSMFMLPRSHFLMPDAVYQAVLQRYRNMFLNIVFANGHRRMNVTDIVKGLREINKLIDNGHNGQQVQKQHQRHRRSSIKKKMVRFNISHTRRKHHKSRVLTPHPNKGILMQ